MLFNSLGFLVFFPVVFLAYWFIPHRFRALLLLVASCYFYMAFVPAYILVLLFLITLDYFLAQGMERAGKHKRTLFLISIVANLSTLFVFKYFNFANANLTELAHVLHWNYSLEALSLALPLGLSFHIFQSISYIIEVYKGRYQPERNYITYALYVLFFPQLVAGPIERPKELLPQLHAEQRFEYSKGVSGLQLMLWGFFKKIVIANNLAVLVTFIYGKADTADGSLLLIAAVAFAFQLYADFSGYSDIARGAARMLGIELVLNFKQPYFSRSVAEFWRRWHISLSSWFRDYVYLPLAWKGGGRPWAIYGVVVVTFLLTGLWHGAGWNFALMGLFFGVIISIEQLTKKKRDAIRTALHIPEWFAALYQTLLTFSLVTIAWIFFRAPTATQAFLIIKRLFTEWGANAFSYLHCADYCAVYSLGIGRKTLAMLVCVIGVMLVYEYWQQSGKPVPMLWKYRIVRWGTYYALGIVMLLVGYFAPVPFIYFQF